MSTDPATPTVAVPAEIEALAADLEGKKLSYLSAVSTEEQKQAALNDAQAALNAATSDRQTKAAEENAAREALKTKIDEVYPQVS